MTGSKSDRKNIMLSAPAFSLANLNSAFFFSPRFPLKLLAWNFMTWLMDGSWLMAMSFLLRLKWRGHNWMKNGPSLPINQQLILIIPKEGGMSDTQQNGII